MIKVFLLISLAITISLSVPCGRCLGQGAECAADTYSTGSCLNGLYCRVLEFGTSAHCWPTLKIDDPCDPEDPRGPPCPRNAFCSQETSKCTVFDMDSVTNDGCHTDSDCASNIIFDGSSSCEKGVCVSSETCEKIGCPLHQYCDLDDNTCKDLPVAGEDCLTDNNAIAYTDCWQSTCIADRCQELFKGIEGGVCRIREDCEPGLVCKLDPDSGEQKCLLPNLELLGKHDRIRWGGDCNPQVDTTGCVCHHGWNTYKFMMEENPATHASCIGPHKALAECVKNNLCYTYSTDENSCLRRKCWSQYQARRKECASSHPSRISDTCSAGTFSLAVLFLFLAVLFN